MPKLIKSAEAILGQLKKGAEVEVKSIDEARRISKSLRANSILGISYEKAIKGAEFWIPYVFICIEPKPLTAKELKAIENGTVKAPKKKVPVRAAKEPKSPPKLDPRAARRAAALEKAKALF